MEYSSDNKTSDSDLLSKVANTMDEIGKASPISKIVNQIPEAKEYSYMNSLKVWRSMSSTKKLSLTVFIITAIAFLFWFNK